MYRSEALAAVELAQDAVREANEALYWATLELQDAECDHPDTNGQTCTHCGEFHIPEAHLEAIDTYTVLTADREDLEAEGFPMLSPWGSEYFWFPVRA